MRRWKLRSLSVRAGAVAAASALVGGGLVLASPAASAGPSLSCDATTPAAQSTVTCTTAGVQDLPVPDGTTAVDLDVVGGGGGAGYPARSHIGGNAAEVTGTATLPAGTAYLRVVVGAPGSGDNHGVGTGGGGSGVYALDSESGLIAKIAIAGAGGAGSYNGDGGNAGSAGTSENAALAAPGQPGNGPTGGAGGVGNYSAGVAGSSNSPTSTDPATGGSGGTYPNNSAGGYGGGGYAGGGGGATGNQGILNIYEAGGGGGSSLASAYLGDASISIKPGTGGIQLPGLVAGDGATGSVVLTFVGPAVPGAPTDVSATPGNGQASVSFAAPGSDGGSPITSYTATSSPGGRTANCPGSPCVVTGLTNGISYTFTVHATNANGDSPESSASNAVTPATPPGTPTDVSATAGAGQASVSFTAPESDGGSTITSYTVTSSPGGVTANCPGSPCVVTGLTNGISYTFTVVATNAIGSSDPSAESAPVTPLSVPGAPTDVTATPGDGQANVAFSAPADDGGTPITSYTVTSSPGGLTGTCPGSPCLVTGLTDGISYTFTVVATNDVGTGAASAPSDAVTPATLPGAPTDVSATSGNASASVSFTAPEDDGGSPVTSYTVTSAPGGLTATCPGSPCVITGLTNGTSYTFTVVATNAIGSSDASAASGPVVPATVPAAPSGVSVVPGDSSFTFSFVQPADGGEPITGYEVSLNNGYAWQSVDTTTDGGEVSGTVTGLTDGITYTIQFRAVNSVGAGTTSTGIDVTPATTPAAPTDVSALSGSGSAQVSFDAPADDGGSPVVSYTVTSSPGGITATCPGSPCLVTGLTNGTSYTFTVVATNAVGDSAASEPSNPVTPVGAPGAPTDVAATAGDGQATVTFTAPEDDGGAPIDSYTVTSAPGGLTSVCPGSPCVITGLTNGTSYTFTVVATNVAGSSEPSAPSAPVTPATVPQPPTNVSADTTEGGQATVTFDAPIDDGGSPITSYTVTSAPDGIQATCPGSPCIVTGLTNGTSYTFTVVATNAVGDSDSSLPSNPVTPIAAPGPVTGVTVTGTTDTATTLAFPAPDDGGNPITGYEFSLDGGTTWQTLPAAGSASLIGTVTGLAPATAYQLLVRAVNEVGPGEPSAAVDVTTLPAAVAAPTATAGTSSVTVTWPAAAGPTVIGYTVTASPGPATCTTTSADATSCVIGATAGVAYIYTVVVHGSGGNSAASPESTPVTASAPQAPQTVPTGIPTTLTTPTGPLTTASPGQQVTVLGSGYLPYSTATVVLYSGTGAPTVLTSVVADAHGDFTAPVTLPATLTAGDATLVGAGVKADGTAYLTAMPLTVTVPAPPAPGGSTGGSTDTGTGYDTGTSGSGGPLAYTGVPAAQLGLWAMLLTAAGLALTRYGRVQRIRRGRPRD